jgi:hypothetical protein
MPLEHAASNLPAIHVDSYSLSIPDEEGIQWGQRASRSAFINILASWRSLYSRLLGGDPFDHVPMRKLRSEVDNLLQGREAQAQTVAAAIEDYAHQLALVVCRLLQEPSWHGVQRIVIGGGFEDSEAGKVAVARADYLLSTWNRNVELRLLHHHPDEGGLIGWVHIIPRAELKHMRAFLAVDIGGTNARCGIVRPNLGEGIDLRNAEVVMRRKWSHAEDGSTVRRADVLEGIVDMLAALAIQAESAGIALAPFVGVACPGTINKDGTIRKGAHNLPGDWTAPTFHLPRELTASARHVFHVKPRVVLHNDAVVQGLSQMPFTADLRKWGVLTIGTGLGNAAFENRARRVH